MKQRSPTTAVDPAASPELLERVQRPMEVLDRCFEIVAQIALVSIMLLTVANVLMRYLFTMPIAGSMNITVFYLMPALVFLALPKVQSSGAHIRAVLLVERLGPTGRRLCHLVSTVVIIGISAVMLNGAARQLFDAWGTTMIGDPPLPVGPSWLFLPIGLLGVLFWGAWQVLVALLRPEQDESAGEEAADHV